MEKLMLERPMTYNELQTALTKAESTISSLRGELKKYKDKFHDVSKQLAKMRNYANKNYTIVSKLEYELSKYKTHAKQI